MPEEDNSYVYDYEIAIGSSSTALVNSVRKLLEKEYEPEGPVFKDKEGNLCQVMLMYDEEK